MKDRRGGERRLVDGLDYHERLVRLEKALFGNDYETGVVLDHEQTRARVEQLESADRRAKLPRLVRWFLDRGKKS